MAIGPILREARLNKQLSESQVAERTRMKIQLVQDLENDDFHRIVATIYGKGFIRLYAECVGLDPKPLINDYVNSVENDSPSLILAGVDNPLPKPILSTVPSADKKPEQHEETEVNAEPEPDPEDLFVYTKNKNTIVDDSLKKDPNTQLDPDGKPSIIATAKQWSENTMTVVRGKLDKSINRMAEIQWGDAPLKIIGIIIGSMIVLLVLTITIKSCTKESDQKPVTSDQKLESLQIPVPPPEPYFD